MSDTSDTTNNSDPSDGSDASRDDAAPTPRESAIDCRKLIGLLGDYVDGHLGSDDKVAVDGHMHQCAPCMAFLRQYRFAPEALRTHLLKKVPQDLEDRLLSFLRKKTQAPKNT